LDTKPDNDASAPSVEKAKKVTNQFALATELPFTLVLAVVLGGGLGYFLDRWLHTKPILMLILGGLGFFAGVREVLRRLSASGNG
jgi:ATP synthase protein I